MIVINNNTYNKPDALSQNIIQSILHNDFIKTGGRRVYRFHLNGYNK